MDTQTDQRDLKLLEGDKYTFAMLSRLLNDSCRLTLTDHERLIICHSAEPYPVWILTTNDITLEEKEQAWQTSAQACPMTDGYRYNLKYDLAVFFLTKAKEQGIDAAITMNLFAYDCPNPLAPEHTAAGHIHPCTPDDLEEAADIIKRFHEEVGIDQSNDDETLAKAEKLIKENHFFFWKDDFNRTVASCSYTPNGDLAALSSVYTFPAHRRKHYAENLVYQVTRIVESTGAVPMLYTDADYAASNACYEKLGFGSNGIICQISARQNQLARPP